MPQHNHNSGNGSGAGPFEPGVWSNDEGPVRAVNQRLLVVLLAEAVARRCTEIVIDVHEDLCPVHFGRGDEMLETDSLPLRILDPLKNHLARLCNSQDGQPRGSFTMSLKKAETSVKADREVCVSVAFGDSGLRLTITDLKRLA